MRPSRGTGILLMILAVLAVSFFIAVRHQHVFERYLPLVSLMVGAVSAGITSLGSVGRLVNKLIPALAQVFGRRRVKRRITRRDLAASADRWFGLLSAILPGRIGVEELGDALEDINKRISAGRPASEIRLKIWATTGWVLLHLLEYFTKRLLKIMRLADVIKAFRGL